MSKIADTLIDKPTPDTFKEHEQWHQSFHNDCSTCYQEKLEARRARNEYYKTMRENLGSSIRDTNTNYPPGFNMSNLD